MFNPKQVVENVRRMLNGEPVEPMAPWFRGFTGTIAPEGSNGRWRVTGRVERVKGGADEWRILELPVGPRAKSFNDYAEWLSSDKSPVKAGALGSAHPRNVGARSTCAGEP